MFVVALALALGTSPSPVPTTTVSTQSFSDCGVTFEFPEGWQTHSKKRKSTRSPGCSLVLTKELHAPKPLRIELGTEDQFSLPTAGEESGFPPFSMESGRWVLASSSGGPVRVPEVLQGRNSSGPIGCWGDIPSRSCAALLVSGSWWLYASFPEEAEPAFRSIATSLRFLLGK